MQTITINGIEYQPRKNNEYNSKTTTFGIMLAAQVMLGMSASLNTSGLKAKMPTVSLETEFELIQFKKSKLSKRERDWVERQFHAKYTVISKNE